MLQAASPRAGRPLSDLLVVSLEQAVAAPYCTRLLADHGARVIKIERPDGGDFARAYDQRARGIASYFAWCNRSKESVALDLKSAAGLEALRALIGRADIFVQNLAPGAAARLGLDSASLRQANPRLISCSITGFGPGGPYEGRKAYDLLIQAEAGLLSVTGTAEAVAKVGISAADIATGVSAHQLILAALIQRGRTGKGDHIEVSMLESLAEWMGAPLYYALDGAPPPPRCGAGHASIYPYGPFQTRDGVVLFGLQNDREWAAFCREVLQREDLSAAPEFLTNANRGQRRQEIDALIDAVFRHLDSAEVLARLGTAGIGTAEVRDMAAVWDHPQLAARRRWAEVAAPDAHLPALVPASGESWAPYLGSVPALGQDTRRVLAEFGLEGIA